MAQVQVTLMLLLTGEVVVFFHNIEVRGYRKSGKTSQREVHEMLIKLLLFQQKIILLFMIVYSYEL